MFNRTIEEVEHSEYFPEGFKYLDCIPPWESIPVDFETTDTSETIKNNIQEVQICVTIKIQKGF